MADTYQEELKAKFVIRQRRLLKALPPFLGEYFRGISDQTSARTRVGYAYDLRIFFSYLTETCNRFAGKAITEFTLADLGAITSDDIEMYMEYLSYYIRPGTSDDALQNDALGKSRKLAAVRTMFRYFYKKKKIAANPAELVDFPKLHEKTITTLEVNEVVKLLDEVEKGEHLTDRQKQYHEMTKIRDLAIITLMLGTGMRVSECIGIDLSHIDFEVNGVKVTRKGGDEMILYFGDEVEEALKRYLDEVRSHAQPRAGHEEAFFLSMQNRRITDRAVQNLVKKYAQRVTLLKNISPHKLRSTFGTQLYRETGDIYLVANVLGHADVNTTRKHYAKMDDEYRRKAAGVVRLRK